MKFDGKTLGWFGAATIASAATLGCIGSPSSPPAAANASSNQPATALATQPVSPVKRSIRRDFELPGVIRADQQTQLHAKLPGFVQKLTVDIGSRVKGPTLDASGREIEPGQILAELTIPELEAESRQKRALIAQAEAELEQQRKSLLATSAGVSVAESAADEAKAGLARAQSVFDRWQGESERVNRLVRTGVIDSQVQEETKNQFQAASASRVEAKAKIASAEAAILKSRADLAKAEAEVQSASARLEVARTEVERLNAMLGYTKIRAPYSAVVTARRVNVGDFVTGTARDAAFTVARIDAVRAVLMVPESDAGLVRDDLPIQLSIAGYQAEPIAAKVARTSWALDPGSRALQVEIDIPNADGKLRPGMFLRATLNATLPPAWTLPVAAVTKAGDVSTAQLLGGPQPKRVVVQTGRSDAANIEIKRFRDPDAPDSWQSVTGNERFAAPIPASTKAP